MGPRALGALLTGAVLALAVPAAAAAPERGLFVPGASLGSVRLGMTKAQVKAVWGVRFGRCRECARTTWYFNYRPFQPQGTGVVFERGRVVHVFTVWQPQGWRTPKDVALGAREADVTEVYGPLGRRECAGYDALVRAERRIQTLFYVFEGEVWAFGLARRGLDPCL